MLKVLVTIVFLFGGGEITMTTEVDTMEECELMIHQMTTSVGEENMIFSSCKDVPLA